MPFEDPAMHDRWASVVGRRCVKELTLVELKPLIDMGMPLKYRHALWPEWLPKSDAEEVDAWDPGPCEEVAKQIELDLPRTQPRGLEIGDDQRQILRRVLNAYAVRNPAVGYCQGMNFIAMVFLVLGFAEATIFSGLRRIVEDILPDVHASGLEGYIRDVAVLEVLVHHLLPAVHQQLESNEVSMTVLALDHFVSLMAGKWPFAVVVRFWDFLIIEGSPAVFASFIALLELYFPLADGLSVADAQAAAEAAATDSATSARDRQASGAAGAAARLFGGVCAAASQMAGRGCGATDVAADDPVEVMEKFRTRSSRGAAEEMQRLLKHTRRWMKLIPQRVIDRIRGEILAESDPS